MNAPRKLTADELDTAREHRRMIAAGKTVIVKCDDDNGDVCLMYDEVAHQPVLQAIIDDCEKTLREMGIEP